MSDANDGGSSWPLGAVTLTSAGDGFDVARSVVVFTYGLVMIGAERGDGTSRVALFASPVAANFALIHGCCKYEFFRTR